MFPGFDHDKGCVVILRFYPSEPADCLDSSPQYFFRLQSLFANILPNTFFAQLYPGRVFNLPDAIVPDEDELFFSSAQEIRLYSKFQ